MPETVVAALIPARGGSEGVLRKNVRPLNGMSLVERAILTALKVPLFKDNIYISTDDPEAAKQATNLGIRAIHRPPDLATSDTPMVQVVLHALRDMSPTPDVIVLLQPTTPTRTWQQVLDAAQQLLNHPAADSVVSVVPIPLTHSPEMVMTIRDHRLYFWAPEPRPARRQDAERVFIRDGTVYATRVTSLIKYGSIYGVHCLPLMLSPDESLNIDTTNDWNEAEKRLR